MIRAESFFSVQGLGPHLALAFGLTVGFITITRPMWGAVWRGFHRWQLFLDDWFGEAPRHGQKERPGAMERLAQLENNGGASLKDTVDRIESQVLDVGAQVLAAGVEANLAVVEGVAGRAAIEANIETLGTNLRQEIADTRKAALALFTEHAGDSLTGAPHTHEVSPGLAVTEGEPDA